jgi:hypothetical protein
LDSNKTPSEINARNAAVHFFSPIMPFHLWSNEFLGIDPVIGT